MKSMLVKRSLTAARGCLQRAAPVGAASVILLEIDSTGVGCIELECDAPESVDVNRVAAHASATANLKLTFHVDHSAGADQFFPT